MDRSNKVREVRRKANMAMQELAVRAGMNPSSLTMIERYNYLPGPEVRGKIAKALDTAEADLFPMH